MSELPEPPKVCKIMALWAILGYYFTYYWGLGRGSGRISLWFSGKDCAGILLVISQVSTLSGGYLIFYAANHQASLPT